VGILKSHSGLLSNPQTFSEFEARLVHAITVTSLNEQSEYSFEILSGNKTFSEDNFRVKTASKLATPQEVVQPAFGTLIDGRNSVPEAIVYASFDGSQTLSSLVTNGNWVLPLGTLRSKDLSRYFVPTPTDSETLIFMTPTLESTVVTNTDYDSPLPPVILGQSYDFTKETSSKRAGLIIAQSQNFGSVSGSVGSSTFKITSPGAGAAIPNTKPQFKGTTYASKQVILTFTGGQNSTTTVTADGNGNWSYTPKSGMNVGKYTLTATSFDEKNKPILLSQAFTILKSGSGVLADATPAASLVPSPSPIILASPIASPIASASASTVPVTGTGTPTVFLFLMATIFTIFGISSFAFVKK